MADSVPTSSPAPGRVHPFGRTKSVYELLGSGKVADLLMWKNWKASLGIVSTVTVLWILFEVSGFTLLTLAADVAMLLVSVVFVWAQAARLMNKSPPPLPEVVLSEQLAKDVAALVCKEVNQSLAVAQKIALGKDFILFGQVLVGLYLISVLGSWFHFLTLVFFAFLAAFTLPFLYDKYEDKVDDVIEKGLLELNKVYKIAEEKVLTALNKSKAKKQE